MRSKTKIEEQKSAYLQHRDVLHRLMKVIDEVIDGSSEGAALRRNKISPSRFRNFIRQPLEYFNSDWKYSGRAKYLEVGYPTWQDQFMSDLLNEKNCYALEDFDVVYNLVTNKCLNERERKYLSMYYREGLTFNEIAEDEKLTKERVRQVVARALRRLRHPRWTHWFLYGKEGQEALQRLQEAQDRRQAYLKEIKDKVEELQEADPDTLEEDNIYLYSIDNLQLSIRSYNCLKRARINSVGDLIEVSEKELKRIRNMGKKSLKEIQDKLMDIGLHLREEGNK